VAGKIWIAELVISDSVSRKIRTKHNLSEYEIRSAIVCNRELLAEEAVDRIHGSRFLVKCETTDGKNLLAWIYPLRYFDSIWVLKSARIEKR